MKTVVLFSGGLDSTTVLFKLLNEGDECFALGIDYGQPHAIELDRAAYIAKEKGVEFEIVTIPKIWCVDDIVFAGRNLILLGLAVSKAQASGFDRVAVGCNKSDWTRFPDCQPGFWDQAGGCAATYGIEVLTPLLYMTKREVVEAARKLNVPVELTWSCYSPQAGTPCGSCLACKTEEALQCLS